MQVQLQWLTEKDKNNQICSMKKFSIGIKYKGIFKKREDCLLWKKRGMHLKAEQALL